jgi:AcrR family transcriptional regulator
MSIAARKEREKHEMRRRILDAAMELFTNEGYEAVSIRKIADKIEYSPAAIYLYFRDKNTIFYELYKEGFRKFYDMQCALDVIADARERLKAHGRTYLKFALANAEYYQIMFVSDAPPTVIKECDEEDVSPKSFDKLKQHIDAAMKAKYIPKGDLNVAAMALWSSVHGLSLLALHHRLDHIPANHREPFLFSTLEYIMTMMEV